MPLYDFKCPVCGCELTKVVWTTLNENVVCPECKAIMIRSEVNEFNFQMAG